MPCSSRASSPVITARGPACDTARAGAGRRGWAPRCAAERLRGTATATVRRGGSGARSSNGAARAVRGRPRARPSPDVRGDFVGVLGVIRLGPGRGVPGE
jgi:hypothetical protein